MPRAEAEQDPQTEDGNHREKDVNGEDEMLVSCERDEDWNDGKCDEDKVEAGRVKWAVEAVEGFGKQLELDVGSDVGMK